MNALRQNPETSQKLTKQTGFTLVELLVAIAIFAVLSALGWKIFDYLIKVKDRNAMHEENLGQLQSAYQQIQRDTLQMIPVTANNAGELEPALYLNNQRLSFSKAGVTDPLKQGVSPYERVEYRYNQQEKKLYRLKYSNLNRVRSEQPLSSVLLSDVDQFQIAVLNPDELDRWPNDGANDVNLLPRGLKIKVMIRDVEYEWIFNLLNTDFLKKNA
ncbi:type II secretion system minor pseudopilin GspJ [Acinetobacter sp. P8-3-8]|uniref:type II secretion system minor pseudopilin GspJ n=1 Tax=Acinetobacter sp. P8-3-8 TaxID=1029823 RepID=UPI000248806A|nr:type II secretion system minor pseudopilin GspJ [Acinetobacter sp. P8-3-8]